MSTAKTKWTSQQTFHLLDSMKGYKPYGLEKHFHMMFILEKFKAKSNMNVATADVLWDHIEEYYNINLFTEREKEIETKLKQKPVDYSLPADLKS